jgi:NAD(P)-dependent dehydrogenase (short-subunit alcohol dehydrogenase family)
MEKVAALDAAGAPKRDKVPHHYSAPMITMTHSNQRVLITAAASGIGLAMADAFLAVGARVFICDVNPQTLQEALATRPILAGMVCDVSDEDQVADFFARGTAHLGGLDILVSNAGVAGPTAKVEDIALADWRHCLAVNLDSAFLCAKLAAQLLRAQGSGSIINMSSTGGLFGFPRRAPYAAAKWAIRGLTRTLAQELGPAGVRVNCICPGSVAGDRMDRVIAAEAQQTGRSESAVRKEMTDAASLKTFILAEDIAQLALFITSPAGARISGQELTVDGHTETL